MLPPLGLASFRLSGSSAVASRAHELMFVSRRSSAVASRAQQLSPHGLSSCRLSGSAAVSSRAHHLLPLGLSSFRLSGPAAVASRAQQPSPLGLRAASASRAPQLAPPGSSATAPRAHQLAPRGTANGTTALTTQRMRGRSCAGHPPTLPNRDFIFCWLSSHLSSSAGSAKLLPLRLSSQLSPLGLNYSHRL